MDVAGGRAGVREPAARTLPHQFPQALEGHGETGVAPWVGRTGRRGRGDEDAGDSRPRPGPRRAAVRS